MKFLIVLFIVFFATSSCTTSSTIEEDKKEIRSILDTQQAAWSAGDLDEFMQGYWKSDSLKFYGSSGLTYGWEQTLANYKKGYPTANHTGTLQFVINDMTKIEENAYYVMGEYHLTRNVGDANGIFMIIFKRINGVWKIIADMSC